jgi:hypothetical protein
MEDRTVKEEVTSTSWVNKKLDWMEETVRVDPDSVWKYPVVVERVGTLTEDKTVREEVTSASLVNKKLDWIELVVMVDSERDTPLMEETVNVDPANDWKYPVVVDSVGT